MRPRWLDSLARITLDGETDRPLAILRNPATRQVRGFLRGPPAMTAADGRSGADRMLAEPGLVTLFGRGIPSAEAWRR
ncbi:MAG: hypothetical protein OXK77_06340 [Gemmatimonadota bacterium]|nr:hypothetical protein [Gemmatimonadota bacterium]